MAGMSKPKQKDHSGAVTDVSEIFGTVDFPLKRHVSPHGRLTAVSMMKDEGPYLLEWVAHHLSLGFTDLVVYTNDCSDGTDDMLIRLEELGLAHHRRNDIPDGVKPQPSALKYAQEEPIVRNSDWVLVFDADEFLCIKYGNRTLDDMIGAAQEVGANGIVITWRIFGSSGVQHWSRAPVTEQYLNAAPPLWNKGWGVKTLFKFDPEYWRLGIHRPKIKNKHLESEFPHSVRWLNGSGRWMEDYFKFRGWRSIVRTVGYDWAQMNHYAIKSMDSYAIRKLRGNVNNKKDKYNADYWSLQDRNETVDDAAMGHSARRREIMDLLLTDEVLSKLHHNAVTDIENRLEAFKKTPAYDQLVSSLREASDVPITQVIAKPPQQRDTKKIAAQMSSIEQKLAQAPKEKREYRSEPSISASANPYVTGNIDLSDGAPVATFVNNEIKLPADPRVFGAVALQAIMDGKFERNHARRLPGLIKPKDRYLEVGAGIGFLAARLSFLFPDMMVVAQEERYPLVVTAARIWNDNDIAQSARRKLLKTPLFHPNDGQHVSSGLTTLITQTDCTILYINDPRLTAEMIDTALHSQKNALPQRIIVGARALGGLCDQASCAERLTALGFAPLEERPLDAALTMFREDKPT